jgi:pyoverdine/dityrosine biosynthesis protein Dit1
MLIDIFQKNQCFDFTVEKTFVNDIKLTLHPGNALTFKYYDCLVNNSVSHQILMFANIKFPNSFVFWHLVCINDENASVEVIWVKYNNVFCQSSYDLFVDYCCHVVYRVFSHKNGGYIRLWDILMETKG